MRCFYWGGCATQRGASPLTTVSPFTTTSPLTTSATAAKTQWAFNRRVDVFLRGVEL